MLYNARSSNGVSMPHPNRPTGEPEIPHTSMQFGRSPDGVNTIFGFQPPLEGYKALAAQEVVKTYLAEDARGSHMGATAIIKRVPDEGKPYSEFQLDPADCGSADESRAITTLMSRFCTSVAFLTEGRVSVDMAPQDLDEETCLFDGRVSDTEWYEEGRDNKLPLD